MKLTLQAVPYVGVALLLVGTLLYVVYNGQPIDTSACCSGSRGPCPGSIAAKARKLLGVP